MASSLDAKAGDPRGTEHGGALSAAPAPSTTGRQRYVFVDALRGFAALAVLLFHAKAGRHLDALSPHMPSGLHTLFDHGDLGVIVFFVLSGFVIAHSMTHQQVNARYVGRFVLRRSIRLDPPYWVSMLLVIALGVLSTHLIPGKAYQVPSLSDVAVHALYLPGLLERPLINTVYWTLCLEIQFYLVFAVLMWCATRLRPRLGERRAFLTVIIPALALASLSPLGHPLWEVPGLFLGHWHLFLVGVLVWRAVTRPEDRLVSFLACADVLLLGVAAVRFQSAALFVAATTACVIYAVGRAGKLGSWLKARPLQMLGLISYSLYLTHNSVTGVVFRVGYKLTGRTPWLEAGWLLVVVFACVGVAQLFYWAFEGPSLRLSQSLGRKTSASKPVVVKARESIPSVA
jgi:peptidoglycan/LPS O-acetylase OafA/YrhL